MPSKNRAKPCRKSQKSPGGAAPSTDAQETVFFAALQRVIFDEGYRKRAGYTNDGTDIAKHGYVRLLRSVRELQPSCTINDFIIWGKQAPRRFAGILYKERLKRSATYEGNKRYMEAMTMWLQGNASNDLCEIRPGTTKAAIALGDGHSGSPSRVGSDGKMNTVVPSVQGRGLLAELSSSSPLSSTHKRLKTASSTASTASARGSALLQPPRPQGMRSHLTKTATRPTPLPAPRNPLVRPSVSAPVAGPSLQGNVASAATTQEQVTIDALFHTPPNFRGKLLLLQRHSETGLPSLLCSFVIIDAGLFLPRCGLTAAGSVKALVPTWTEPVATSFNKVSDEPPETVEMSLHHRADINHIWEQ